MGQRGHRDRCAVVEERAIRRRKGREGDEIHVADKDRAGVVDGHDHNPEIRHSPWDRGAKDHNRGEEGGSPEMMAVPHGPYSLHARHEDKPGPALGMRCSDDYEPTWTRGLQTKDLEAETGQME